MRKLQTALLILTMVSLLIVPVSATDPVEPTVGVKPVGTSTTGGVGVIEKVHISDWTTATDTVSPAIVSGEGNHLYVDLRLKRVNSTGSNGIFYLQGNDGGDRRIFSMTFNSGKNPLVGDVVIPPNTSSTSYGGENIGDASANTLPTTSAWESYYVRAIITRHANVSPAPENHALDRADIQLFAGPSLDALGPLASDGTTSFQSGHQGAINITRIRITNKSQFDTTSVRVYEVDPNGVEPSIQYNLGATGNFDNDGKFDLQAGNNDYAGTVTIRDKAGDTLTPFTGGYLIAAWYEKNELVDVFVEPVEAVDDGGNVTVTTDAKTIASGTDVSKRTLVVYLWNGVDSVTPVTQSVLYGADLK